MPYFNFDLVFGEDFKSQGGMILEDTEVAIDKADSLASELCIVRPELRSRGCAVRVTDTESKSSTVLRSTLSRAAEIVPSRMMGVRRAVSRILGSRDSYFVDPRYVVHTALANVCDVC